MKLLINNKLLNKDMRDITLKNMLLNNNLLLRNKWNNINNNRSELLNMKDNNWQLNMYNFNKNNNRLLIINDKLVENLLRKMINMRINKVLISKIQFNHSINKLYIKYYYYNIDNNNNNVYSNIMLRLINNMNRLSNILSYYYNKEVIIQPIKVTYVYMNNNIMSDYIKLLMSNNIDLNNQLVTFNNKSNIDTLIREYLNLINNFLPINNNNFINLVMNNNNNKLNNNINNLSTKDNINDMIELMRYRYLMGWSIRLKGKLNKTNQRSVKLNIINGTLKNNVNKYYKYNYLPNNHYVSNLFNINKDGKYNIKVKLNYI